MNPTFFSASAILFELNSVLADTLECRRTIYTEFLSQFGLKARPDEFEKLFFGLTDKEIVNTFKANYNLEPDLRDLDEFFFLLSNKAYDESARPIGGAVDLLKFLLSLKFKLGLVTYSSIEVIREFLAKNGLDSPFGIRLTGDAVAAGKPSPEMYIQALSRLNLSEVSVIVIEGSKSGIISAYKAGIMKIIGIGPRDASAELMKSGAMMTVESLEELRKIPWTVE